MPPFLRRSLAPAIGLLACVALFLVYATYTQRYVWGTDCFGYLEQGRLFAQGRIHLWLAYPSNVFPAIVPAGFTPVENGGALPNYPPGYPLLLAIGHLLRAPLLATPAIGVVSSVLIFFLLRGRVPLATAAVFTLAHAFMPLTVYGSTMLMSDGPAATALLGALLAYRHNRFAATGWLLALAIAIRPTNALFLAPFCLVLRREGLSRLGLHFAVACALYGLYNWRISGAPWRTGYGNAFGMLDPAVFSTFLPFFVRTSVAILSPVIVVLALVGLFRPTREKLLWILWPLILLLFYSFWKSGGTGRWWWTRFLLPGLPLLYLLAAEGFETVRTCRASVLQTPNRLRLLAEKTLTVALFSIIALLPFHYVRWGKKQQDLWVRVTGASYHEVVQRAKSIVPPGSLVGTNEHGSTFLMYSGIIPFGPTDGSAGKLVETAFAEGRRVFVLPEPWIVDDPVLNDLLRRFRAREIARYDFIWDGLPLYELSR